MMRFSVWAAAAAVAFASQAAASVTPLSGSGWTRIAGNDRYATAVMVSSKTFAAPVDAVLIASGVNFPDALSGGPAAAALGVPVLLVPNTGVPQVVRDEVARLKPSRVIALGGAAVVPQATLTALADSVDASAERIAGQDRFETAALITKAFIPNATTYYIASGESFADAMVGGPAAFKNAAGLLLTAPRSLPSVTADVLKTTSTKKVVILGGTGVVSTGVESKIKQLVPTATVTRQAGADRYATAAVVANATWPNGSKKAFFATGADFPDALSATPAAGLNDAPILLTTQTCHPYATAKAAHDLDPTLKVALGGQAVTYSGNVTCGPAPTFPFPEDLDCSDFPDQASAQRWFAYWYPRIGDLYNLDRDHDMKVCEIWPPR